MVLEYFTAPNNVEFHDKELFMIIGLTFLSTLSFIALFIKDVPLNYSVSKRNKGDKCV